MSEIVTNLELGSLTHHASGKVREIFDLGDTLLFVATDRISAFDVVLPQGIPGKGKVLNQISLFWFDKIADLVKNHLITATIEEYPEELKNYRDQLSGRSMLVKKAKVFPVECIVRGYIVGSGWKDYLKTGSVSGVKLPEGLSLCDKLEEPIFTPSTKADEGHDENISYDQMIDIIGEDWARQLRDTSLAVYSRARDIAAGKGIIIADTKFEFGLVNGELTLIDEVLTPDSSRFWPRTSYSPGRNQPSYDKQYVRDYLETLNWDKKPPAPELPVNIIGGTADRYREAFRTLTGKELVE